MFTLPSDESPGHYDVHAYLQSHSISLYSWKLIKKDEYAKKSNINKRKLRLEGKRIIMLSDDHFII